VAKSASPAPPFRRAPRQPAGRALLLLSASRMGASPASCAKPQSITSFQKLGWRNSNRLSNLVAACRLCNAAKGDLSAAAFLEVLAEFDREHGLWLHLPDHSAAGFTSTRRQWSGLAGPVDPEARARRPSSPPSAPRRNDRADIAKLFRRAQRRRSARQAGTDARTDPGSFASRCSSPLKCGHAVRVEPGLDGSTDFIPDRHSARASLPKARDRATSYDVHRCAWLNRARGTSCER
jgi:hypothetical protein